MIHQHQFPAAAGAAAAAAAAAATTTLLLLQLCCFHRFVTTHDISLLVSPSLRKTQQCKFPFRLCVNVHSDPDSPCGFIRLMTGELSFLSPRNRT